MDVKVANLSNGQRNIEKMKEKTKNHAQLVGKTIAGAATAMGTGILAMKSADMHDMIVFAGKDGFIPKKSDKFLAAIDVVNQRIYDDVSKFVNNLNCKEKISDLIADIKNASKGQKAGVLVVGLGLLAFIAKTSVDFAKYKQKDAQIDQKYN